MEFRDLLLYGLDATFARINRTLEGVEEADARRSPTGGLSPIIWQVGHIALSDLSMARRADGATEAPAGYAELFRPGTGGEAAYPPLAEVRGAINRGQQALEQIARTADPGAPIDAQSYKSVGEMLLFAAYHRGYHIGKMNTLRALLGKARLFG